MRSSIENDRTELNKKLLSVESMKMNIEEELKVKYDKTEKDIRLREREIQEQRLLLNDRDRK